MSNTQNNLELLVKISADTASSKAGLDTQLKTLATQLKSLEVPIKIDPAAIAALTNLSKLDFSKLSSSMKTVEKDAKSMATVSAKEVEQAMKQASEKIGMSFKGVLKGGTNDIEMLKKQLQGLDAKVKVKYDMVEGKKELESMTATIQKAGVATTTTFSKVMMGMDAKEIVWIPKTIQEIDSKMHNAVKTTDQFVSRINKLQAEGKITNQEFEKLANSINKMGSTNGLVLLNAQTDGMVASNKKIVAEQEKQKKQLKEQADLQEKIRKLTNDITSAQGRNPKAFGNNTEVTSMLASLRGIDSGSKGAAASVKGVSDRFGELKAQSTEAGRSSMGVFESFKVAMEKFPIWMASSTIFFGVIRSAKEFGTIIIDIDTKMTSLRKVMAGDTDFEGVFDRATKSAERFGQSISEVMDSYVEFAKQGYKEDELGMLADSAVIASNVGDISAQRASEYMTATLVQWKKESSEAMGVIDSWNELSNNYATTTEKLAQGHA